jgi:hypothetical protein
MISRSVLDEESETHPRDIEQGLLPVSFSHHPQSIARQKALCAQARSEQVSKGGPLRHDSADQKSA